MRTWVIATAIGVLIVGLTQAQADALRVLASNGVKAALEVLQPQAEQHIGRPLDVSFATSASTRERITRGERFDVAVLTTDVLDELTRDGRVAAAPRASLGKSGIGVGARAGAPRPDIRTADALKRALLAARSLTWASDGASRPHITRMLETLGITDAAAGKTVLEQGSVRATARVARGETDLVITLVSEILPVAGIELVGPLPAEFQSYVSFSAGVASQSARPDAARTFITFLGGPEAHTTFVSKGIE